MVKDIKKKFLHKFFLFFLFVIPPYFSGTIMDLRLIFNNKQQP